MKTNKRGLILVLASLFASESLLEAHPGNARESNASLPYVSNPNAFDQNARDEISFWESDRDTLEAQEQAATTAEKRSLENKIDIANEHIMDLTRQLNKTTADIKKIKQEHAELKKKNKRE